MKHRDLICHSLPSFANQRKENTIFLSKYSKKNVVFKGDMCYN